MCQARQRLGTVLGATQPAQFCILRRSAAKAAVMLSARDPCACCALHGHGLRHAASLSFRPTCLVHTALRQRLIPSVHQNGIRLTAVGGSWTAETEGDPDSVAAWALQRGAHATALIFVHWLVRLAVQALPVGSSIGKSMVRGQVGSVLAQIVRPVRVTRAMV
jgi:hypothetical protein